jgi:regulator of protease activity HflC (stomatin/prohibitin superfamily)
LLSLGIAAGLVAYLLFLSSRCFFRVEEGHLAVLTSFGAAERKGGGAKGPLLTYGPGLHRKWPWQRTHHVAMMEQSVDLSGEEGGRTAMAEDGTLLRFDSVLRFLPMEDKLDQYLFGMRAPVEHITGLFTCILRNEIANFRDPTSPRPGTAPVRARGIAVVAKAAVANGASVAGAEPASANGAPAAGVEPAAGSDVGAALATVIGGPVRRHAPEEYAGSYGLIRRERKELNRRIETFCREQMGDRYGVRFNAVDLTDILPPDELAVALNAVINAHTEAETRYARAEADCRQRVLASERGVDIARARAAAVETEISTLARHLAGLERQALLGEYVARRKSEALAEARTLFLKGAP